MVESRHSKPLVAGSSPVIRSKEKIMKKEMSRRKCKKCGELLSKLEAKIGRSGKCFKCAPLIKGIYPTGTIVGQ